jgi:predicted ferric reductase
VKRSDHPPTVHSDLQFHEYIRLRVGGTCVLLEEDASYDNVFNAGGIGVTPLLSMYSERPKRADANSLFRYPPPREQAGWQFTMR